MTNITIISMNLILYVRQIFPAYLTAQRPPMRNSALGRIRERRARIKSATATLDAN